MFQFEKKIPIVPLPQTYESTDEVTVVSTQITVLTEYENEIKSFAKTISSLYDIILTDGENGIVLIQDDSLNEEEYTISCDKDIQVHFCKKQGLIYAFATLVQLLKKGQKQDSLEIIHCNIKDKPYFGYRGLMIDVARRFHPIETLYRFVDLCFLFKLNYFQIHFNDSVAVTLPLTAIKTRKTQDYCYTKEQIKDLIEYAQDKGVCIVPEIELPGHSQYLIEQLKNDGSHQKHTNALCTDVLDNFEIIRTMISEVIDLFPQSPYIHLGADEVPTGEWDSCETCQSYCKRNGIASTKELYSHFVAKMTNEVIEQGKRPIVWEGFPKEAAEHISKNTIVMVFESYYHQAQDLVDAGFDIINATWKPLYVTPDIAWPVVDIYNWNPKAFSNWIECSPAYHKPLVLRDEQHLLGAQLCAWECTYEQEIEPIRKNIVGIAEKLWSEPHEVPQTMEFMERYYNLRKLVLSLLH